MFFLPGSRWGRTGEGGGGGDATTGPKQENISYIVSWHSQLYLNVKLQSYQPYNRPFASCFEPHHESEAKCIGFIKQISFHSYANKTNFENHVFFFQ